MPTEIIKTIRPGGGGDFSSLSAWEAARQRNLVTADEIEIAECFAGGNLGTTIIDGWTTDLTRFIIVRPAEGSAHNGRYREDKAFISGGGTRALRIAEAFTEIHRLCLRNNTGTAVFATVTIETSSAGADGVILDGLIVRGGRHGITVATTTNIGRRHTTKNCVAYGNSGASDNAAFVASVGGATIQRCNVFNCTLIGGNRALWANGNIIINSQNNYLSGGTSSYVTSAGGVINKGSHDATANTGAIDPNLRNIPHSTLTFENVTAGSENYHLIVGSDLVDVGKDINSSGVSHDYERHPRPFDFSPDSGYDIGGDELFFPTISGFLGGYIEGFTPNPPVSGFIGGFIEGDPLAVPPAFIGGYILSKAIQQNQNSALLGGFIQAPGTQSPTVFAGGYINTLTFTSVPIAKLGGAISGLFGNSAKIGGFIFGYPSYKEFAETHARVLVKANSEDVVDQPLSAEAIVIFKALGEKSFNARLSVERAYFASFNAKLDVQKFKEPPLVEILSVSTSGLLGGCTRVFITASGTLKDKDSVEFANAQINFCDPLSDNNPLIFKHNSSISGFTKQPPWSAYHDYCLSGIYNITVVAQDNLGMVGTDIHRLNLASGLGSDLLPQISISGIPRMNFIPPAFTVDFNTNVSGILVPPATQKQSNQSLIQSPTDSRILWMFGNREISRKKNPRTRYVSPGLYAPILIYYYTHPSGQTFVVSDSLFIGFNI